MIARLSAAAFTAVALTMVGLAAPAAAIDVDGRWGDGRAEPVPDVLIAPAKPQLHCHRVRVVPARTSSPILFLPCAGSVLPPLPGERGTRCQVVRNVPATDEPVIYVPCPDGVPMPIPPRP